ncbi:MAG: alkaline phosphatase D [Chitinophagales bacterium]|jgi:alkaline phosphatase D
MKLFRLLLIILPLSLAAQNSKTIQTIAFGSCSDQNKDQSILYKVVGKHPDLFIYLGDNIYGDTHDMDVLRSKYDILGGKAEHQALRQECEVLATWDDHDYGKNDAGKKYEMKKESKALFLDFWKEPGNSSRYAHDGIYHSEYYGSGDEIVQVILLDTRSFRTRLKYSYLRFIKYKNSYRPNFSKMATILGEQQWLWLEEELKKPASIRIIASSNQFAHEYNGYESWTNFPLEQERLLQLIQGSQANGVICISGDVHWGEISKLENSYTYPIYDVTSSGLTQTWHKTEPNSNRIGEVIPQSNFGIIQIDWEANQLELQIYDEQDSLRARTLLNFKDLQFD